ncbi:MAG: DNA primase [Candidatus Cloacimonetes bacterium]|nr:DNA primase [Candidatus Cloacimonadota bacterium]
MKKNMIIISICLMFFQGVVFTVNGSLLNAIEPHFMTDPAISPNGKIVCFSYMSDIWVVSFDGGEAKRLTTTRGNDWDPVFSPNGEQIAFNTERDGWWTIYTIPSGGGKAEPVNKEDMELLDWFPDGKSMLAKADEPGFRNKFFKVDMNGTFREITAFGGNNASVSQNGKKIIFDRRGLFYREAYKGSFNGDLWEYDLKSDSFSRLTKTDLTEQYPVYSNLSNAVYFAASDGKVFQLYKAESTDLSKKEQLTKFKIWSVRNISIAKENDRIVFEKFDELWKYDPDNGKIEKLNIDIKQDFIDDFIVKEDVCDKVNNFDISNDGKLVVFSYKYDLFAVPEKGDDVKQITFNQKGIHSIQILNDNQTVIYTGFVDGQPQLFRVNIKDISGIEKLDWSDDKYIEWIKADGNRLLINFSDKDRKHQVAIADSLGNNIRTLIDDQYVIGELSVSPDEKYALYIETRQKVWSRHIYLYYLENDSKELLFNFDGYLNNPCWGKDHKSAFIMKNNEICRIDLQAKKDFYKDEDNWKAILDPVQNFKEEKVKKAGTDSISIDPENISQRITTIVSKPGKNRIVHVLNDSTFYYLNTFEKKTTLRKVDYFGEGDKRIYSFSKKPADIVYNEENKSFYFIENEQLKKLNPKSKKKETVRNKFKYRYNKMKLNKDVFDQAWIEFGKNFYDPKMHGIDWKKSKKRFSKYLEYAFTPRILKLIIHEMIGELNASHTGFYPRKESEIKKYKSAYCGMILDLKDILSDGVRVKKVFRNSKLSKPNDVKKGDILFSVDGKEVGSKKEIDPLFMDKVGEKLKLGFQSGDAVKMATIKGLSYSKNRDLYYDNWVEERRGIVEELSAGKVGYLHIRRMSNNCYKKFVQDMFAENSDKEAMIIDVRNNGGGGITDKLIEVLTRKYYAGISRRYFDAAKYDIPYKTWGKPVVLLINENSFSDAEIFPTIFRQMELGTIIGMPTSGSVIGTGRQYFMDGSSMRMPTNGIFRFDGTNMEGSGVVPDIIVEPTPEQIINDDDVQLKKAIEEILKEM